MTQDITAVLIRHKKTLLWGIFASVVVGWLLGGSIINLFHNKLEKRKLTLQSAQLDKEYENLRATKERLDAQDLALLEEVARLEYHLAKPGEVEFRFDTN